MRSDREERIARCEKAYRAGRTLEEIGSVEGISREYVRQLLKGRVAANEGGYSVRMKRARAKRERERDARYVAKYGMTRAEFKAVDPDIRFRFKEQRQNARRRGFLWTLKLAGWLDVWGDRIVDRGRGADKLVLAMIDTEIGFVPGNVRICTHSESSRATQIRRWSKKALVSEAGVE